MAQTGFTPIQLYSTSTAAAAPSASNLTNSTLGSELAINITDGKLFYKDNANVVQVIGWKVVPATAGGTGQTSYAVGDLLFADSTTTLAKLADVATGNALISGGVGVAPLWGKIGLTTHISGTLPVGNGGTGLTTLAANRIPYGNDTSAFNSNANFVFTGSNLGVGTATPAVQVVFSGNNSGSAGIPPANILRFNDTDTSTDANQPTGRIEWFVNDASAGGTGVNAFIEGRAAGTSGGGYLVFATSINGTTTAAEIAQFTSDGNLLVGTTTNSGGSLFAKSVDNFYTLSASNPSATGGYGLLVANNSGNQIAIFRNGANNRVLFSANGDIANSTGVYGTISDAKLKENIVDATSKLEDILKLKVRNFNLTSDLKYKQIGFIAQEFEQVFPSLVAETLDKDLQEKDLGTVTKSIKTSALIPILVKAIQEQQTLINDLTNRLNVLEAK
jgi:hypothetical protein